MVFSLLFVIYVHDIRSTHVNQIRSRGFVENWHSWASPLRVNIAPLAARSALEQ
jgi:hypothetical protein